LRKQVIRKRNVERVSKRWLKIVSAACNYVHVTLIFYLHL
jgi:hypothetical protein